jgi:hypothetical protein
MKPKRQYLLLLSAIIFMMAFAAVFPALADSQVGKARVWVEFAPGSKANVEKALAGAKAEFHFTFDNLNAFVVTVPEAALAGLANTRTSCPLKKMPSAIPPPKKSLTGLTWCKPAMFGIQTVTAPSTRARRPAPGARCASSIPVSSPGTMI